MVGIDGVGTKIEVADAVGDYSGVGYDVVAMCVNDVLCHCAKPIAFLDYFVTGSLNRKMATEVVASIAGACREVISTTDSRIMCFRSVAASWEERPLKCPGSISQSSGTWLVVPLPFGNPVGPFYPERTRCNRGMSLSG